MAPRTLVTGSTGNIGSIVATQLQQAGHPFVAGTRRPLSEEAGFPTVPINFGGMCQVLLDSDSTKLGSVGVRSRPCF